MQRKRPCEDRGRDWKPKQSHQKLQRLEEISPGALRWSVACPLGVRLLASCRREYTSAVVSPLVCGSLFRQHQETNRLRRKLRPKVMPEAQQVLQECPKAALRTETGQRSRIPVSLLHFNRSALYYPIMPHAHFCARWCRKAKQCKL